MLHKVTRFVFWLSAAAMCLLTFVWPFTVSDDGSDPVYRVVAIVTLLVFFASMTVLLARRAQIRRPGHRE